MATAWETKPRITTVNDATPVLKLTTAMSRSIKATTIEIPLTTGETFHADGKVQRLPRGEVDTRFVPRRGTVNLTEVTPPVPLRVPMRTVRMPKGVGAVLVIDWGTFCATQIGTQIAPLVDAYSDLLRRLTAKQDLDLAGETAAMTQFKPQEAAQRLKAATLTKVATQTKTRRSVRIRGYSRA